MIRNILLISMLIVILIAFTYAGIDANKNRYDYSKEYFISNSLEETGSNNIVTSIYLDYRLFDSIFEASILLIAVTGIIFISKRDDEVL